uniref:Uncharacterized protein n=1 Tax=Magallana gigas TaxID=29159 RepID=K1R9Q5_MAGGI
MYGTGMWGITTAMTFNSCPKTGWQWPRSIRNQEFLFLAFSLLKGLLLSTQKSNFLGVCSLFTYKQKTRGFEV